MNVRVRGRDWGGARGDGRSVKAWEELVKVADVDVRVKECLSKNSWADPAIVMAVEGAIGVDVVLLRGRWRRETLFFISGSCLLFPCEHVLDDVERPLEPVLSMLSTASV